jgi:hypothetical protein
MKTMLLAAAAVLSIGATAAYAGDGGEDGGTIPNTFFTELPRVDAQQGEQPNNVAVNRYYMTTPQANTAVAAPPTNNGG